MQNGLAQPMPWLAYPQDANRKASGGRLVRPALRGALLGLEIGTSQGTPPVGVGRFGRTPHIALSGVFLALRASDCNGWPRRWVSGRTARLAPRKNLPDSDVSSEPEGCYATLAQLKGSAAQMSF